MSVSRKAEIITRWAERMGYRVEESLAQTGTRYLTCTFVGLSPTGQECNYACSEDCDCCAAADENDVEDYIANHGECYCREDITVDPEGLTTAQAVQILAERIGKTPPGWTKKKEKK